MKYKQYLIGLFVGAVLGFTFSYAILSARYSNTMNGFVEDFKRVDARVNKLDAVYKADVQKFEDTAKKALALVGLQNDSILKLMEENVQLKRKIETKGGK